MPSTAIRADLREHGIAMIAALGAAVIVTVISLALIGLMNTDLTHASIQHAVARSFYIAQAGLAEAKIQVAAAADPAAYTTPAAGVTISYGGGRFTFWVDAGPATSCGEGFKTLEALGEVAFLGRMIPTRVRACGVPGTPFLAALFGVSRIEFQGNARTYLPPAAIGTPGRGGSLGSFTEINFSNNNIRLNALSEDSSDFVTLRDRTVPDYTLFGFTQRPDYNPNSMINPRPWILSVFGDIIKSRPAIGAMPNRCGTAYACVTVGNGTTDIEQITDLRESSYMHRVYVSRLREETLPPLALDPEAFRIEATHNTNNAAINNALGLAGKADSDYELLQFYRIVAYLRAHPSQSLQGTVYVDGSFQFIQGVNLGNITLAIRGDLIVDNKASVTILHDLSTIVARRQPGIVVLGFAKPVPALTGVCGGQRVNGTGRLILCEGTTLTVDGLVYTQDGMAIEPGASVDQIGAMYHDNRGTGNASFSSKEGTVVVRFDPLALTAFGRGIVVLSWQQLR